MKELAEFSFVLILGWTELSKCDNIVLDCLEGRRDVHSGLDCIGSYCFHDAQSVDVIRYDVLFVFSSILLSSS